MSISCPKCGLSDQHLTTLSGPGMTTEQHSWPQALAAPAPPAGLDVERLARALRALEVANDMSIADDGDYPTFAAQIAAAYDVAGEGGAGFFDDPNAPGNER